MDTTNVYHFAVLVGIGIALGMFGAITSVVALSKLFDWVISKTYKKLGVVKWAFGEEYNHYQYVSINGVKWQVLPSPNPKVLLLAHHTNRQNKNTNKHIVIDSFEGNDSGLELAKAMEVNKEPETHVVAAV